MELCYRNNPQSLFRKYARLITFFTRHQLGRDFLGIPYNDIGLLLPNGYHRVQGNVAQATFFSRPKYSKKLYPALQRIDVLSSYFTNFDDALKTFFYQTGLIRNPYLVPDVYLTVTTVNPDADPETTTVDGLTYDDTGGNRTWSDLRAAAGDGALPSTASVATAGWTVGSAADTFSINRRGIFLYDTSSIPDGDEISGAVHSLYCSSKQDLDSDTPALTLTSSTPASNTNLVAGDYAQVGLTTRLATDIPYASITTSAYNDHTLNAAGLAAISKTGVSKFAVISDNDFDNTAPGGNTTSTEVANITVNYAESASNDPKLVITHAPADLTGGIIFI